VIARGGQAYSNEPARRVIENWRGRKGPSSSATVSHLGARLIKPIFGKRPMLRAIRLHPYKVHTDLSLSDLPTLSILVGPNNSGKSAVLQAASLPKYGLRWDPTLPNAPWEGGTKDKASSAIDLDFGSGSVVLQFTAVTENQINWEVTRTGGGRPIVSQVNIPQSSSNAGPFYLQGQTPESLNVFYLGAFREVPNRAFSYRWLDRDLGPDGGGCWNMIHQLKAEDNPKFEEIQLAVSQLGLGSRARTPSVAASTGSIRMENYGRTDTLPFVGSGTGSVLPVITQGILCESCELFLVEEPELHLHRSALDGLGAFFGKLALRGVQVILTTHSTAFFSALYRGMESGLAPKDTAVFVFDRKKSGETSVNRLALESYHKSINKANAALGGLPL
jgi:hypothetical protein